MKMLRLPVALLLILQFVAAPPAGAESLPYTLVDRDQYDIFAQDQAEKEEAALAIQDPPDDAQLLKFTNEFWRQAVTSVEGSYKLDNEPEPIPDLTLLNPTLSLPLYGTSIALTGRYVLGFQMAAQKYKQDSNNDIDKRNTSTFEMQQEMQLKMQGKILERVFVDIDYDDQREEEKTISVAYRGKPGELVQLAEFGDINLSLPETEFIAYQKQLFGAKMHLQHKNANLYLIGSQTKGSSKQKQFIGSSVSEIISLADTSYLRRTYYDLTFGGNVRPYIDDGGSIRYPVDRTAYDEWRTVMGSISPGTEEIYYYSNDSSTSSDYVPIDRIATDALGSTEYPAKWQLLTRGVDYTVDYASGIITFKRTVTAESVIAVDYRDTRGNQLSNVLGKPGTIKLIKTENDKSIETGTAMITETANKLELKTYYNIGAQKITQDNGKGNFILQLQDANGQALTSPYYSYPTYIDVDFDSGIFDLAYRINDAGLYGTTPTSSKNLTFKIQYESTVKTYFIESGIVIESETVKLNGRTLTRNNDYYIDYTSGFITFYKGDEITENSVIDITYDTTTGSSSNNSVMGGRLDYKLFDKIIMGATMLKESGEKPNTVPQVGNYAKDLLVYGADINGKDIRLAEPLSVDFSAEIAKSQKNQNLFGYAMVDSMNEATEQVAGSRIFRDWIFASNPSGKPAFLNSIHWDTQDLPSLEINPHSIANYNDKQQVLVLNYDFTLPATTINPNTGQPFLDEEGRDEVSIVYPLSQSGMDLSSKTSFELTMLGEANGPQVNFAFGNISEYSDSSNGMNTQCGTNVPKTEDIYCRNTLAPNEDIGWLFTNPDGTEERYNPFVNNVYNPESQPNGRIDTQDLNGNGVYDAESIPTQGNFGFAGASIDGMVNNTASNTAWTTYTMPLLLSTDEKAQWTAVRHLRITLKITDEMRRAGKLKGQIKIANVSLSGTAWNAQNETDPDVFSVAGINNVDNTNYEPIFADTTGDGLTVFNYLYGSVNNYKQATGSANALDQALNIKFNTIGLSPVRDDSTENNPAGERYANRNFSSMDFTQHREFRFLLHGAMEQGTSRPLNQPGTEFFLKVGTENNFDKIIVPTDFRGWRLISLRMVDTDMDGVPDSFENISDPSYNVRVVHHRGPGGLLNFREVSLMFTGVQAESRYTYTFTQADTAQTLFARGILQPGLALYGDGNFMVSAGAVKTVSAQADGSYAVTLEDGKAYTAVLEQVTALGSQGEVWLNVIHLAEAITLEGTAYKGDVVVNLDGWGSAGAKYKYQDSNFETPLAVSKNQEVTQEEYFLKVDKIKEFPMQANLTRSSTVTPLVTDTTDYNTISLLDKGKVDRQNAVVRGDFKKDNFPQIGLEYTLDQVEYDAMKRKDDARTYGATLTHSAGAFKNITAGYHITDSSIDYDRVRHLESDNYYNTDENTQKMNMKVTYQPTNNFNFTPSYSLSKSKEDRTTYQETSAQNISYPKAMSQNTGFNSTWKITKWLAPSVSYNISTVESNNLTAKTLNAAGQQVTVGVGEVKTINRNADGGISLTLNGNEILPNSKLFNTFVISSSYRIQDADSWYDVDSDYDSRKDLWIRSSLKDVGEYGYRKSLTLRDTFTSTQRWSPLSQYNLEGAAAPLKTISLINNFTRTLQTNDQTGTLYDSTSLTLPDMTFSISDLEKFFYGGRWFSSSNLKLRYSWVEQTTPGTDEQYTTQYGGDLRFMLFNYFDTVLNYTRKNSDKTDLRAGTSLERIEDNDISAQTSFYIGSMRVTPKLLHTSHEKWLVAGQISESSTETTPSLNLRWDFNLPRGFKLPFINKMYNATNRVIWNTTFSYTDKRSPVEVKENYKKFDFSTSLDYELSQNLRFTVGGGFTLLNHAYVETEDYTAYNVAANVTVQF